MGSIPSSRTDNAIAVQSELQRSFLSMTKTLHPLISAVISSECPRWLKLCCQDSYFSSYTYRQTRIMMGEEFFFFSADMVGSSSEEEKEESASQDMPFAFGSLFASRSVHGGGSYDDDVLSNNSESYCGSSIVSKGSESYNIGKSMTES